jgi:cystathionine beta-lyase family protein involved in aluminum resistance
MRCSTQQNSFPTVVAMALLGIQRVSMHEVTGQTRVCHIQRSCGYALRPTLTIADIRAAITTIRQVDSSIIITVDNCYGEFTEEEEPGHAGADLVMGSLIKNPGGTLAPGATRLGMVHISRRSFQHQLVCWDIVPQSGPCLATNN